MKNLFISLVVVSFLFTIGCQDNNITEPISNQLVDKIASASSDTYQHGFITLEGALNDPHLIGNSFYLITGQIEYELRTVIFDPMLPAAQRYVSLYFTTNADFRHLCTVCAPSVEDNIAGFISDVSENYVPCGGNYVSLLEKTYSIQGRNDRMMLKVRFLVTLSNIELSAMWLALPDVNTEATAINHY